MGSTRGERFVHMIETFYGLARLGHTDRKGMPYSLQLALSAQEFKRCDRLPFAFAGGATRDLWRTRPDRALARVSRDVPAALAYCADASDVAPAKGKDKSIR